MNKHVSGHGGKLLFEDGDWELWGYPNNLVLIWHNCDDERWAYSYEEPPRCSLCFVKPPIELVGLRNLHMWDR